MPRNPSDRIVSRDPKGVHPAPRWRPGRSRRSGRGVAAVSLLVSAAIHAFVLSLSVDTPTERRRGGGIELLPPLRETAMRVVDIDERRSDHPPPPEPARRHRPLHEPARPPPSSGAAAPPSLPTPSSGDASAVAPMLTPHLTDPRIWVPVQPPAYSTSPERARLEKRMDAHTDSTAGITIPPGDDMSSWTRKDAGGKRWGVSPGALHLGSLTIPFCRPHFDASDCGFGVPPSRLDAYEQGLRALIELRGQARRLDIEKRARAIRARHDAKRDSAGGRGGG